MSKHQERRRSFRVTETALLDYKHLSEEEFNKGIDRWRLRSGGTSGLHTRVIDLDARIDEALFRVGKDVAGVAEVARLLNEKINTVMEALPEFQETRNDLVMRPAQECEIGSEGMLFGTDEDLAVGTRLLIRFLVLPENRLFETFARVRRIKALEPEESDRFSHRVAVEFHGMNSAERENLIQHLFMKQTQVLRLRRKEAEEAEE